MACRSVAFPRTLRSLRGWSIPAAVLDEVAFFRLEGSADSDVEIQASIRRGMLAFQATRLIKISTPYMKSGILFDDFQRAFGRDNPDLLVWRAPSTLMNPSLHTDRLARERRLDPTRFAREYEAEFADDVAAFLPAAWVTDAVVAHRHELPPQSGVRYFAGVDPSGGGADNFALAVVYAEDSGRVVQDVMKGRGRVGTQAPDLAGVVAEYAAILDRYGCSSVVGDKYAGQWVRQAFADVGIQYRDVDRDRSSYYLEVEPLFSQGRIDVLDHPTLVRELRFLERRPRAGGVDRVDHPRGGHDDHANALAIAAAHAAVKESPLTFTYGIETPTDEDVAVEKAASASMVKDAIVQTGWFWPE